MEEEAPAAAPGPAEAPAPGPAPAPAPAVPKGPFDVSALSVAQIQEIFKAGTTEKRLEVLGKCLAMDAEEVEDELRKQIWLEMLHGLLRFCKEQYLSPTRTHAFVGVMAALHTHAVESKCSKAEGFDFFMDAMLGATKALPLTERFSLSEVQSLTAHARTSYLDAIRLHQLVYTEEQTLRESSAELFLQTPAVPPPLKEWVEGSELPPAPADEPAAPAANDALTDAIAATINSQVEGHQQQLAAEFAAQEQVLLDRIAALETKIK